MMKKTDWIDAKTPPVYIGLYERQASTDDVYWSWWNGTFWGVWNAAKKSATTLANIPSSFQLSPWRGLTEPYKGWKP